MSRKLASMISVRFEPDEAKRIREAAEHAEETLSTFVRMAALDRAGPTNAELVQNGRDFLAEWEREFGPLPEKGRERAREFFNATEGRRSLTMMVKDGDGVRVEAVVYDHPLPIVWTKNGDRWAYTPVDGALTIEQDTLEGLLIQAGWTRK